jgi:RNA polymerase sigma-B factor
MTKRVRHLVTVIDTVPGRPPGSSGARHTDNYDHFLPLLEEFAALDADDPRRRTLRERLVAGFLPVAQHIATRYRNRGEPLDDLEQVAAVGLLKAVDRYDPAHDRHFLSYAIPTITGEVQRHFRDKTWAVRVPRALKDLQGPVRQAVTELSRMLQRAPRPSEIAAHLGIGVEQVIEALQAHDAHSPTSFETPVSDGNVLADTLGGWDAELEQAEYRHTLRPLLAGLPERERTILVLRFVENMTQTQIAAQVGISQMHVSRLLAQTLAQLRGKLDAG